jgi:hypothetical protein
MSLAINVDRVEAVLLADGWHEVSLNDKSVSSFTLDAYDFIRPVEGKDPIVLLSGGTVAGVPSTGASWVEKGVRVACPVTAVLAVKENIATK